MHTSAGSDYIHHLVIIVKVNNGGLWKDKSVFIYVINDFAQSWDRAMQPQKLDQNHECSYQCRACAARHAVSTLCSVCAKRGSQSHALADTQQSTASIQDLSMGIKAKRMVVGVVHNLKITRIPNCMEYYLCTSCISMYTEWSWHQWWDKEESHWILWVPGKYCSTRIMLATLYWGPLDIRWQLTSSCHGLSYSRYIVFQILVCCYREA